MDGHDLVSEIQRGARLRSAAEARRLLESTLQALAYVLPAEQREAVCTCVPEDARWCLRCGPDTPDPLIDSEVFLGWVMSAVETTGGPDQTLGGEDSLAALAGDEARARVRAVLEALWERMDAPLRTAVGACLPHGVAGVDARSGPRRQRGAGR